jgi:hypothetical protein
MRYSTLIIGVLFAQIASADATEVLVKARDQTTANWADALSKQFNGTVERLAWSQRRYLADSD